MGIKSEFRQGMRVTDDSVMNVVEMVLGELNQEIVGLINQHGGKAVGLTGQDGAFIHARKMLLKSETAEGEFVDIGLVGEIERIDPRSSSSSTRATSSRWSRPSASAPRASRTTSMRISWREARGDAQGGEARADDQHRRRARQARQPADRPHRERDRRAVRGRHHLRRHAPQDQLRARRGEERRRELARHRRPRRALRCCSKC
jgi:hypothetical protein